jgi:putative DNA-invertase from lambdoid prophage Rac
VTAPATVWVEEPGTIARHLRQAEDLGEAARRVLRQGRQVRRGQGSSLRITAPPQVHHDLLAAAAELDAEGASAAERKAYRIYAHRARQAIPRTDSDLADCAQ